MEFHDPRNYKQNSQLAKKKKTRMHGNIMHLNLQNINQILTWVLASTDAPFLNRSLTIVISRLRQAIDRKSVV